jgi:anti-anti-sigma factor
LSHLPIPRFAIDVTPQRSRVVMTVSGELDIATVGAVRTTLAGLRDTGWDDIVVDLDRVPFIDSTGLALLLEVERRARSEGWAFAIVEGCKPLQRLLMLTAVSLPTCERDRERAGRAAA